MAGYKGRAVVAQGEAFEATPENIESRVQRLMLLEGIKVTLLSKKSRGEEVRLLLTLHYGNENNLKGMDVASACCPNSCCAAQRNFPTSNSVMNLTGLTL